MSKKKDIQTEVQGAIDKENFDKETETQKPDLSEFDQISVKIWKPEAGEFIMGKYDGSKLFESEKKKGDQDVFIQYIIDSRTKDRVSFLGGVMLDKALIDAKVGKGDMLYCCYEGTETTSDGNPVNIWDVRVKKDEK